jgi:hypothetical protein
VIDQWQDQSESTSTGTIALGAGTHQVKVEYYEATGRGSARQLGLRRRELRRCR